MAITKEAIRTIVNFEPGKNSKQETNRGNCLGEVSGKRLVYGIFPYQRRVTLPGEPLVFAWTRQPTLALVEGERVTTLAYTTDVRNLGESLAVAVAEQVRLWNRRTWPEDY